MKQYLALHSHSFVVQSISFPLASTISKPRLLKHWYWFLMSYSFRLLLQKIRPMAPELIASIVFGIIMFTIALVALIQGYWTQHTRSVSQLWMSHYTNSNLFCNYKGMTDQPRLSQLTNRHHLYNVSVANVIFQPRYYHYGATSKLLHA